MKKKLALICASLLCSTSVVNADTQAYSDIIFDWAEQTFTDLFPVPATVRDKLIQPITAADKASLSVADLTAFTAIAKRISDGEPITEADLTPGLKDLNNRRESYIFRGYSTNLFAGTGVKPLTPSFSEVVLFNAATGELTPSFGTIGEIMTSVPAATTDGTTGCATLPRIAAGTKVVYDTNSLSTATAVDQKQTATYKEVSATKLMIDIKDESFGATASTQNMTITQEIVEANGWRSLKKNRIAFNDAEVAGTFTEVTNEIPKLLGPAGKYCTDQTWTTNAVKQVISGQAVANENGNTTTNPISQNSIDELVQKGKVMSTSESVVIGSKTYDTIKVSITNVLSDFTTNIWYDKATGVDVKEVIFDDRAEGGPKKLTETIVSSIE